VVDRVEYVMVRPPGWVHIPIDEKAADASAAFAHTAAKTLPPEKRAMAEQFIVQQLAAAVAQAEDNGGQDLLFPGETVNGAAVPLSIVVAQAPMPAGSTSAPRMEALTSFSVRSPTSQIVSVGGEPAIRQFAEVPTREDAQGNFEAPANRRVTYLVWSPGQSPRLMMFVGTIMRLETDEGASLVEALEFLFDTLVSTVRFVGEKEASV
jgi:hypothetical protein